MRIRFLIVGSTLHNESPGDLDILAVISREDFKKEFSMTWEEISEKMRMKDNIESYKNKCRGATLVLSQLFDKRHIDLKFVPDNMPYGDRREVQLSELASVE